MNKTVKILLFIFGGFILLSLAVCGGGYMWFQSNKDRLKGEGERVKVEASQFAAANNQEACLTESIARLDRCDKGVLDGTMCRALVNNFLSWCLTDATKTSDFCAGVPKYGEIMATVTWSLDRCAELGREGDEPCTKLVNTIPKYCSEASGQK